MVEEVKYFPLPTGACLVSPGITALSCTNSSVEVLVQVLETYMDLLVLAACNECAIMTRCIPQTSFLLLSSRSGSASSCPLTCIHTLMYRTYSLLAI
jgi:hypothetical protein